MSGDTQPFPAYGVSREYSGLMRLAGGRAGLTGNPALPAFWKVPNHASPALIEVAVRHILKGNKPHNNTENEQHAFDPVHTRHSIPREP